MSPRLKSVFLAPHILRILPLVLIILISAGTLFYQINRPYGKILEHGTLEVCARNFLEEGFGKLYFLPTLNLIGGKPNYYLNHPPLVVIMIALFMKFLGDSEISVRLAMIISSGASLYLLYKIVRAEISSRLAYWTILISVLLPIFFYYGRIVNYDSVTLFLSLLTIWLFAKSAGEGKFFLYLAFFLSIFLGALSDWPYYLTPPALFLYALLRKKGRRLALGAILTIGLLFWLILSYYSLAARNWGGDLTVFQDLAQHVTLSGEVRRFLWSGSLFYSRSADRANHCFTAVIPFLALAGLIINLNHKQREEKMKTLPLSVLFLALGLGFIVVFPGYLFHHDWGFYMLIPGAAFLSASALLKLPRIFRLVILSVFIFLSAFQFYYYHGSFNPVYHQLGEAIKASSSPGDIIFAPRGWSISYYAQLQTQFSRSYLPFFYKKFKKFILRYHPDFIVTNQDQNRERRPFLRKEGYALINQNGLEVWGRKAQSSQKCFLASFISPKQRASGWSTQLATFENTSFFAISRTLKENTDLTFKNLTIDPQSRLAGFIGFEAYNFSRRSYSVVFTIEVIIRGKEDKIFTKVIKSPGDKSKTGWIPFLVDLSPYQGEMIDIKLENSFYAGNKKAYVKTYWGNLLIQS